ncbi:MAG: antibiotic biosynthesis monooxygenase [Longimicrobiales bacterium]
MISRVWRGWTTKQNAAAYESLLLGTILPGIAAKQIPGYQGVHAMRKDGEAEVEFVTVMWFDSVESVKAFVGNDYEVAYVPEAARDMLERFDGRSSHYDVFHVPDLP